MSSTGESPTPPQVAPTRILEGDNPFGIAPEADLLSTPRHELPLWSETMFFMVWSPSREVGVWLHMGVVPEDKTLWWAQVYAMLPEGRVLVDRSYGRAQGADGPDTGNLKVRCVEPLRRWRLSFDGAAEITSTAELATGLRGAGIAAPLRFEIDLAAAAPVYDMHAAMTQQLTWNAGHVHHEQTFAARGSMTAAGEQWSFDDGIAVRDHSLGERDFQDFNGWVWSHALWPRSGRVMAGAVMWRGESNSWIGSVAMVREQGRTEILGDFQMEGLTEYGGRPEALEMQLVRADGTRVSVHGEVLHNVTMTYAEPNHNLNGALLEPAWGLENQLIADESVMRWVWDGEVGYGHVERAIRPAEMPLERVPAPPGSVLARAAG